MEVKYFRSSMRDEVERDVNYFLAANEKNIEVVRITSTDYGNNRIARFEKAIFFERLNNKDLSVISR